MMTSHGVRSSHTRTLACAALLAAFVLFLCGGALGARGAYALEALQPESADNAAQVVPDEVADSPVEADGAAQQSQAPDSPATVPAHEPMPVGSFPMPDLVGMNFADALELLRELGIHDVEVCKYVDGRLVPFNPLGVLIPGNWTVQVQSVEAEKPVDAATEVLLALMRTGVGFEGVDIELVWSNLFGL